MNNQTPPEVVEQWRAEFLGWLLEKHMIRANFIGDELQIPPRSGRSVRLVCGVALQAWMDSRQTLQINLPRPMMTDDADYRAEIVSSLRSQGYQVRVKGE